MDTKHISGSKRPELQRSALVSALQMACADEALAIDFIEARRWGGNPACPKCGSIMVYKMTDAMTGGRNKRYLWRCRDCKRMFTVRTGTVFEESLIPLRHWCYAFWRVASSKKGVAAMEIMRDCQISYKSALFLLHRVRFALAPAKPDPMTGTVEADETYIGGKPRPKDGKPHFGSTDKAKVFGVVERGGRVRRRIIPDVSSRTVVGVLREMVDPSARLITDNAGVYRGTGKLFAGGHESVNHSAGEYARGDVHSNTIESSFALVKRGLFGIYHAVSREHLHRYLAQFDFVWNTRKMNDGDRAALAIQAAEGRRLKYRASVRETDKPTEWPTLPG